MKIIAIGLLASTALVCGVFAPKEIDQFICKCIFGLSFGWIIAQ